MSISLKTFALVHWIWVETDADLSAQGYKLSGSMKLVYDSKMRTDLSPVDESTSAAWWQISQI